MDITRYECRHCGEQSYQLDRKVPSCSRHGTMERDDSKRISALFSPEPHTIISAHWDDIKSQFPLPEIQARFANDDDFQAFLEKAYLWGSDWFNHQSSEVEATIVRLIEEAYNFEANRLARKRVQWRSRQPIVIHDAVFRDRLNPPPDAEIISVIGRNEIELGDAPTPYALLLQQSEEYKDVIVQTTWRNVHNHSNLVGHAVRTTFNKQSNIIPVQVNLAIAHWLPAIPENIPALEWAIEKATFHMNSRTIERDRERWLKEARRRSPIRAIKQGVSQAIRV